MIDRKKIADALREIASFYAPDPDCANAIYDSLTAIIDELDPPEPEYAFKEIIIMKYETINGTLCCRMVEPEPLTPEANFPCVVRLIQDDSPMGRNNDFYATSHLLAHIEIIHGLDAIHFVRWQGSKTYYSRFEIIGYPVADGSLEWALYQVRSGKKVVKEGCGERYVGSFYENRLFYLNGSGCLVTKNGIGLIDPCSEGEFLSLDETGWQLYKEPKPEHPAINGYNRYDYIPVEGIRQPKPEPEPPREAGGEMSTITKQDYDTARESLIVELNAALDKAAHQLYDYSGSCPSDLYDWEHPNTCACECAKHDNAAEAWKCWRLWLMCSAPLED